LRLKTTFIKIKPLKASTKKFSGKSKKNSGKTRDKRIKKTPAKKSRVFYFNQGFIFSEELKSLVLKSSPASKSKMFNRIKKLGRVKLAILAGIFLNQENSKADILIVGDDISDKRFRNFVKDLEAEAGKEICYSLISTEEFDYRLDMCDRFIRDLLEYPHEKLINKLKL